MNPKNQTGSMKTANDVRAITFQILESVCGNIRPTGVPCQESKLRKKCKAERCPLWNSWPSISNKHKLVTFKQLSEECRYFGKSKNGGKTVCAKEQMGEHFVAGSCRQENCNVWTGSCQTISSRIISKIR